VPKTTKKQVQERVNLIISLLAQGIRPTKICENAQVKEWNVSESQVWRYIGKAYKYFEGKANVERDKELGTILERYEFLYNRAVATAWETKDYGTAAGILDKRAELIGLKKIIVAGELNVTTEINLLPEETSD
jgi:hypothetical protein